VPASDRKVGTAASRFALSPRKPAYRETRRSGPFLILYRTVRFHPVTSTGSLAVSVVSFHHRDDSRSLDFGAGKLDRSWLATLPLPHKTIRAMHSMQPSLRYALIGSLLLLAAFDGGAGSSVMAQSLQSRLVAEGPQAARRSGSHQR